MNMEEGGQRQLGWPLSVSGYNRFRDQEKGNVEVLVLGQGERNIEERDGKFENSSIMVAFGGSVAKNPEVPEYRPGPFSVKDKEKRKWGGHPGGLLEDTDLFAHIGEDMAAALGP